MPQDTPARSHGDFADPTDCFLTEESGQVILRSGTSKGAEFILEMLWGHLKNGERVLSAVEAQFAQAEIHRRQLKVVTLRQCFYHL